MATIPGYEGSGRVFGSPTDGREWILDGAVVTDRRWAGNPMTQPSLDAIQEFTVEANAVSAKMSRPVNLIMTVKSGTNQIHGTAFETLRNNAIGLARARTDYYAKAPKAIRNEYGASAGGPLVISQAVQRQEPDVLVCQFRRQAGSLRHNQRLQRAHGGDAQRRFQRRD